MNNIGEVVYNQVAMLSDMAKDTAVHAVALGAALSKAKNELLNGQPLFRLAGFETWPNFIVTPACSGGVGITTRMAGKYIKIYETFKFKVKLQDWAALEGINEDALYAVSKVVNTKNYEEWLDKARTLTLDHLTVEIDEAQGKGTATSEIVGYMPWDKLPKLLIELIEDLEAFTPNMTAAELKDILKSIKRLELRKDKEIGCFYWNVESSRSA